MTNFSFRKGTYRSIVRCREVTASLMLTWVNWQPLTNVPIHVRNHATLALMQVDALSKGFPIKGRLVEPMFSAFGEAIGLAWILTLWVGWIPAIGAVFIFNLRPSLEDGVVALLCWFLITLGYLAGSWKHQCELMRGALISIAAATDDRAPS